MDIDDISEIDPALPDPDFFDADDRSGGAMPAPLLPVPLPEALPLSNVLSSLGGGTSGVVDGVELKYDDELCEFDEFLVSLEESSTNTNVINDILEPEQEPMKDADQGQDSKKTAELNNSKEGIELGNVESSTSKTEGNIINVNGSNKSESGVSSRSNTPVSRPGSAVGAGAAVVRLSLPKVSIESKRISLARESPEKSKDKDKEVNKSPPRMTRGRLNPPEKETRAKRRLSVEHEEDDWTPSQRSGSTTRSGRPTRKATRYGFEDDDSDEDEGLKDVISPVVSVGESDLFEPVRKKRRRASYWTDDDGTTYYTDRSGTKATLKKAYVYVTRIEDDKELSPHQVSEKEEGPSPVLLEVCVDNIMSIREAVKGGANRIELCSSLAEGGLTPTCGFLQLVKESFKDIPVFVMIRPRGGDFLYDEDEIEIMTRDISYYKQNGADGFVFGVLTKDSKIDVANCKLLLQTAYPLPCTFHRAFDLVSDPYTALETIINIGFKRILTSGQQASAHQGLPTIIRLIDAAKGRILIMPGCGINEKNIGDIVKRSGVTEIHGSASKSIASLMSVPGPSKSSKRGGRPKQSGVKMGNADDLMIKVTDSNIVAQMVKKARQAYK
ncbi:unnamed protein product [Orchesella dallaii]|uniref:Copper homeostasis protein cutC homolog n=1 Tax=Orchesella dallaii TaxID=48710 RepID=A0ABP1QIC2_9HEXA